MPKTNMISSYRYCMNCDVKENRTNVSACPNCKGYMFLISQTYMPKVKKKKNM